MTNLQTTIHTGSFYNVAVSVTLPKERANLSMCYDGMYISTTNFNAVTNPQYFGDACKVCIDMLRKLDCVVYGIGNEELTNDFNNVIDMLVEYINKVHNMSHMENSNMHLMNNVMRMCTENGIYVGISISTASDTTLFTFDYGSGIG